MDIQQASAFRQAARPHFRFPQLFVDDVDGATTLNIFLSNKTIKMNALRHIQRVASTTIPTNRGTFAQLFSRSIFLDALPSTSNCFLNGYYSHIQQRCMSKYVSKSMKKNLPLTTKRARKGFYKGKGGTKEGKLNSIGRFIVNPLKRVKLVVPNDLSTFRLKPYIASSASRFPPEARHNSIPS